MTRFTASTESEAVVSADRDAVWEILTDPAAITRLTPLVGRIDVVDDLWVWHMSGIPGLPVSFAPTFTERMHLDPKTRIDYEHAPQGKHEPAAVNGWYALADHPAGTRLGIRLEMCVSLPLPRLAAPMVQRTIGQVLDMMGSRFAARMLEELDAHEVAA